MGQIDSLDAAVAVRGTAEHRRIGEILWSRMHLLTGTDRALLQMYLENGSKFCQMARLMGVSPTSVARRVRRIIRRLTDDTYMVCLDNRDDFTGRELGLIRDYFVRGLSMARISREHDVTFYRVRAAVAKARRHTTRTRTAQRNDGG